MENAHTKQNQNTKMYKIPCEVLTYDEGTQPVEITEQDELVYEPTVGEKINVCFWCRYPSYDFIFGTPDVSSPKHEKEIGFMQMRDTRAKSVRLGVYVDLEECEEIIEGMKRVLKESKTNSPHLWKQRK